MWSASSRSLDELDEILLVQPLGGVSDEHSSTSSNAYLVFVRIVDIHFLPLPPAFPFLQFLSQLFRVLPLVGRPVLVGIIEHGPSEGCRIRSDLY